MVIRRNVKFWKSDKFLFFVLYSIVFACMAKICFISFEDARKGFGWVIDSLPVQLPMLAELRNLIRDFLGNIYHDHSLQIPSYDFRLGMGGDALTYLSMWYLEPVSFLAVFFDYEKIELVYDFLVVLRLYLAGLSFGVYSFYMKGRKPFPVVFGALIYVFSGWTFFFLRHPVFYATLIYLPILFIGVEEILKKKSAFSFPIMIFLSSVTHYYFLYINTIFIVFYFIMRYWDLEKKKTLKAFLGYCYSAAWRYLLGIGLSMVIFLPNIITFLNSNRTGKVVETGSLWRFGKGWLPEVVLSLAAANFTPGFYLYNGFAVLGIIIFLVWMRKRKSGNLKLTVIMVLAAFAIPFVTFAFHGFSSVHFRWNYILGFLFGFSVVRVLSEIEKVQFRNILPEFLFVIFYSGIQVFYPELSNANTIGSTFFFLVFIFIISFYIKLQDRYKYRFYYLFMDIILIALCCNIYYNAQNIYSLHEGNYVSEFVDKNSSVDQITDTSAFGASTLGKDNFYRIDTANGDVKNENAAVFLDYYGISFYVNVMDKYLAQYNYGLENRGTRLLDTLDNDNRTIMDELASVRYFTVFEGEEVNVPYGYTFIKQMETPSGRICKIYENDYFLPMGYTYNKCISESNYTRLNALEKQEVLMQAAVVEDDNALALDSFLAEEVEYTSVRGSNITIYGTGCEYDEESKTVTVYQNGGFLTVGFEKKPSCETYIRLKNLNIDSFNNAYWIISLFNDELQIYKDIEVRSNTATYSYGCYNYLINLGYLQEGMSYINIGFPFSGEFKLDEIQVFYQPMDNYEKNVLSLKENVLEDVTESVNSIAGKIKLNEDKILVLSIPYSIGWTAYVDGEKKDLNRMNVTFMGLRLEKGIHTIELRYCTPGLKAGGGISGFSVAILIILFILSRKEKVKRP